MPKLAVPRDIFVFIETTPAKDGKPLERRISARCALTLFTSEEVKNENYREASEKAVAQLLREMYDVVAKARRDGWDI